jgi:hypothetical protein
MYAITLLEGDESGGEIVPDVKAARVIVVIRVWPVRVALILQVPQKEFHRHVAERHWPLDRV